MANRSEIGDRSIIKRIESDIGVVGQGGVPSHLSGNDLQGVIVFGQKTAIYSGIDPGGSTAVYSIAASAGMQREFIGTTTYNAAPLIAPSSLWEYRLNSLAFYISYDAAGAIADNGKKLQLGLYLNGYLIVDLNPWVTVTTGILDYKFSLFGIGNASTDFRGQIPQFFIPYIEPSGQNLRILISRVGGGVFPAATSVSDSVSVLRAPKGILPPL